MTERGRQISPYVVESHVYAAALWGPIRRQAELTWGRKEGREPPLGSIEEEAEGRAGENHTTMGLLYLTRAFLTAGMYIHEGKGES